MPGVARKGDVCSGHGCFPPRPSATWSPDTFVNSLNVIRAGDAMLPHCCKTCHGGVHTGSHNVYVNGRAIQTCGDGISCGSVQAACSGNTFVN